MVKKVILNLKRLFHKILTNIELVNSKSMPALMILRNGYGIERSIREQMSIDKDGCPLPWYTYPAIEYLKQLDFSTKTVYEFGCGNSSLFWSENAKSVISVEEDEAWYKSRIGSRENLSLKLRKPGKDYYDSILEEKENFDVIIVDGNYDRDKCCEMPSKSLAKTE